MAENSQPRHSLWVRITHWLTALAFLALLVSGLEIVVSHPRFYWGEVGNVNTPTLFRIPIPSSRNLVPTGYGYVLPDQPKVKVGGGKIKGLAGRSGRARTCDPRFWRPVLYQLSYTPNGTGAVLATRAVSSIGHAPFARAKRPNALFKP